MIRIQLNLFIEPIVRAFFWLFGFWLLWKIPNCRLYEDFLPVKSDSPAALIHGLKLSVIIPARNEENTLGNLLTSLFSQKIKAFEVIIVNDQSTDRTEEIAKNFDVKIINIEHLPEGWLGKAWACYNGARQAQGDTLLFLDADTSFEQDGLEKLLSCYLKYKGVITVQPYHRIKKFYENFAAYFNIIMMGSMNVFTPLQSRLKPIGAFGPCLLCDRQTYFSINGHKSAKKKILEDIEIGKKFLKNGIYVYCFGGRGTISFRMYPYGLGSVVNGFARGFIIGASSTSIINLILIIFWIAGAFFPITLFFQSAINFNLFNLITGIVFYIAYASQVYWIARRIGNFSPIVAIFYPVFMVFFIVIFFWSLVQIVFRLNVKWKGRTINK